MKNFCDSPETNKLRNKINIAFSGLSFDEETHTYMLNGKQLISTTTYLKRFSEAFNSYHASEAKGRKKLKENANDNRTGLYYRQRWKLIGNEASMMGTRVHLFSECFPNFDYPMDWREQAVLDFYEWLPDNYVVLFLELRVYDESTLHAGTVDGLLLNKDTGNLVIFDWKTNKRNINEVYNNKKLSGDFSNMYNTNLNKYTIQLSDYANVIQTNTDLKVEERWIVWLRQKPVNKKDKDRNDKYTIKRVKVDVNKPNFKLYKVKDVTKKIDKNYKKNRAELKEKSKPAKVAQGLFSKKQNTYNKTKKKSLFSKK